ncbi:hypothetical protein AAFC00_005275 [Neodothiora populina]|uniref:HIG1 domain-containing protein n=1 Tax=Neodothiora populina TaxID=2781224 RepID=A0ABR3PLF1_9PEZI
MKILTKEEEQEHYNATVKGGTMGGLGGLAVGALGVALASRRYPAFRSLSVPFRAFLITSSGTFSAIISADKYSRAYEAARNPEKQFVDSSTTIQQQLEAQKPTSQRLKDWGQENRYSIVFGSWVASMVTAFALVGRNPYLSGAQKLVQARVYAQGLTMAVVIASVALEAKDQQSGAGRWETVKVLDPNDPTHKHVIEKKIHHERYAGEDQWMDMVAAEEERIKQREAAVKAREEADQTEKGKKVKPHSDPEHGDTKKSDAKAP